MIVQIVNDKHIMLNILFIKIIKNENNNKVDKKYNTFL